MSRARLAFVLCAGIGKRLKPLTDWAPKALLPLGDRPMVFHVLDELRGIGVRKFIVNLHSHPALLKRSLVEYGRRHRVTFIFLHEKILLDTGGALRNARRHLTEPFWLINCDAMPFGMDLERMDRNHSRTRAVATLAVRPMKRGEPFNPVGVSSAGRIIRVTRCFGRGGRDHVFLGVHLIEPVILSHLPAKKISPIFSGLYRSLFESGATIRAHICRPRITSDLGTIEGYFAANISL